MFYIVMAQDFYIDSYESDQYYNIIVGIYESKEAAIEKAREYNRKRSFLTDNAAAGVVTAEKLGDLDWTRYCTWEPETDPHTCQNCWYNTHQQNSPCDVCCLSDIYDEEIDGPLDEQWEEA